MNLIVKLVASRYSVRGRKSPVYVFNESVQGSVIFNTSAFLSPKKVCLLILFITFETV